MSRLHEIDAGQTVTEYQETVVDPDIGEPTQVQCANCGAWRLNSRLYCPTCGARNVQSTSVFLTEEEILAKAGMSADELRATISQPRVEKSRRRLWLIGGFVVLLGLGGLWAHQARNEALQTKQAQETAQAQALAAEKAREAASAAKAAETALAAQSAQQAMVAASAAQAAASAPVLLSDEQATKLGLNTPAPKPRKLEPAPVVTPAPSAAPVTDTSAPVPEPAKPEPKPAVVVAPKIETPQERLATALSACKGRGGFFERNACEFNARKQYCPGMEGTIRDCPVQRNEL